MKTKLRLHLLLLALLSLAGSAHAQGTAIGYQGRLNDGGSPATGLYDLGFQVFDVEAGGAALAAPVVLAAVPVTNGLFNVSLDFGPDIFIGPARWLEILVRANDVGLAGVFTSLTPRTRLLPTPYAIFAGKAGGVASGTLTADQLNSGGVLPMQGQFLSYDGGNFLWRDPAVLKGDVWSVLNNNAYYNAGNVGIGTATPARKLTVRTPDYGIEHTDGTVRLGTYLDSTGGWLGTVSDHPLKFFVKDGALPRVTIDGDATSMASGPGFVSVGTPNAESGTSIKRGDNRADVRFDGSTLKLVAGLGFGPPSSLAGIAVSTAGNVGIGTVSPQAKLEVNGNVRINSGSGIALNAEDGPIITRGWDPFNSNAPLNKGGHGRWGLFMEPSSLVCGIPAINGKTFDVRSYTPEGTPNVLFRVNPSGIVSIEGNVGIGHFDQLIQVPQEKLHVIGNILASGTITGSSDRNVKRDFAPVNSSEVLDKVAALPISTWSYIADDGVRHLGPMAQDFYSAFNVGMDDKHISMVDADGVALAAIQGLNQKLNEKVTEIGELKSRLERLENLMNQKNGGAK